MTLLVFLVPLLTALVLFIIPGKRAKRALAILSSLVSFALALFLGQADSLEVPWIGALGIYFSLDVTGAAGLLVPVVALVMIPTILQACFRVEEGMAGMLSLLFAMQAGLYGIFMAKDLVLFYMFWELSFVISLLMLGIYGREKRREAAMKYLVYALAGSLMMLLTILAIKPLSGALSYRFSDLFISAPQLNFETQMWLFVGFSLAFVIKLPLWPLHAWLIPFHEQNHPSGVADVAGTMYKVGGFGFFAWALPLLPEAAHSAAPIMLTLAAFTAVYAAVIATTQGNLKSLLAYASLSHMGIVAVGLFGLHMVGLNGAIFLLAAQMLSTGGLFLITGMLYQRKQSFALDDYGGLAKSAPALASLCLFVLFTSIGVPGLANFPGEFMSLMGAFQHNAYLAAFACLSVIAAGVYGVNLYQRLFQAEANGSVKELGALELVVLAPIVAGILWLGISPNPQLKLIESQTQMIQVWPEGETLPLSQLREESHD